MFLQEFIMKYSIEQSEITERTEQINKFALLVDLFNNKAVDRETFMAELSKIEQTDWAKENLFNQLGIVFLEMLMEF